MKSSKIFIAYLLVVVFLLGTIAASAQTTTKNPVSKTVKGGLSAVVGGVAGESNGTALACSRTAG